MTIPPGKPLRIAVVGAGPRSVGYAHYALEHPREMEIVAVADPNSVRRNLLADAHHVPAEARFDTYDALAARPQIADAVFNTTLDTVHYPSTLALLRAGFHVLLEKPIAPTEAEVRSLIDVAREHKRIVMVCHILRYEPFYQAIQRAIADRRIGRLTSIQTSENVSYDHLATTFLRHPRNLDPSVLPMLLSKCCHDLDLIAWLAGSAGDASLKRVASLKTPTQFRPSNAPLSSTERCLDRCGVESTCRYSARALYVEDQMWDAYSWPINEYATRSADADKLRILATTSPYGRCVWRCPNKIVDHQSVIVEFASGVTASHDLFCATSRPGRTIRVVGTDGELEGNYESGQLLMRKALRSKPGKFIEDHERVAPPQRHSQFLKFCESALIADFLGTLRHDPKSPGLTRIEDSLIGHQIAYAAESASQTTGAVQFGVAAG